jgi:hypothetical protein
MWKPAAREICNLAQSRQMIEVVLELDGTAEGNVIVVGSTRSAMSVVSIMGACGLEGSWKMQGVYGLIEPLRRLRRRQPQRA